MDAFERLAQVIAQLRSPEGCPWDKVQTHDSLKPYLVEEVYEVLEAIDKGDSALLCEELGDLLLQIVLHAQIAAETGLFSLADVATGITEKMIRRHPHVFSDVQVSGTAEVWRNWEQIKKTEKVSQESVLDSVPLNLPALFRAAKVQKKAARLGFDWPDNAGVLAKIKEEIDEFAAESGADKKKQADEFGDILFSLVNLARKLDIDAEDALRLATKKFESRFRHVEKSVNGSGKQWKDFHLAELDQFWDQAKNVKM